MEEYGSDTQAPSHHASQKEMDRNPKQNPKSADNETEPTAVNEQSTNSKVQYFETSNTDKQSLCSPASEFMSQDSQYVTINISKNEKDPLTMPLEERQKLARAKRNREAAYRSRAKNKIRQFAVEEETRRSLALNAQLRSMLEFLLARLRSPSAMENGTQNDKRTKNS